MWRDPMDELIDDLEQVLPAVQDGVDPDGDMRLFLEMQVWTDRMFAEIGTHLFDDEFCANLAIYDDPGFQDHVRRWNARYGRSKPTPDAHGLTRSSGESEE